MGSGSSIDFFTPHCEREPCHLNSEEASLYKDTNMGEFSKLTVENAYVTGGGIQYPVVNAIACKEAMEKAGYKNVCEHTYCSYSALRTFAEFVASEYFDDETNKSEACYTNIIEFRQTTFLNSITSAQYAEIMGFINMFYVEVPSWSRGYANLVLAFNSTKVELFHNDTAKNKITEIGKVKYNDNFCTNTGLNLILDEDCINATMTDLKASSLFYPILGCDGESDTLTVVASSGSGARNGIKEFLTNTETGDFFTKQFTECSLDEIKVEVLSGQKEAKLGMEAMEKFLTPTNIAVAGYLDFGGNTVQPSFWITETEIFPTEISTDRKLNSFLNFGADAVSYRVSQLYRVFPKYTNVCEIGSIDFALCIDLIEFIALGGDHWLTHD